MSTSQFVGTSTWMFILLIIAGVLLKVIDNNFITWFFFAFLCIVGLLNFVVGWPKQNNKEKK